MATMIQISLYQLNTLLKIAATTLTRRVTLFLTVSHLRRFELVEYERKGSTIVREETSFTRIAK